MDATDMTDLWLRSRSWADNPADTFTSW